MILTNEFELQNTRTKLAEAEQRYQELLDDTQEDPRVRRLTLHSYAKLIKQFKEDIARYQAGQRTARKPHEPANERELEITRKKLEELETHYQKGKNEIDGDEEMRSLELHSLKRIINQLKEEIARYEAHQPVRR